MSLKEWPKMMTVQKKKKLCVVFGSWSFQTKRAPFPAHIYFVNCILDPWCLSYRTVRRMLRTWKYRSLHKRRDCPETGFCAWEDTVYVLLPEWASSEEKTELCSWFLRLAAGSLCLHACRAGLKAANSMLPCPCCSWCSNDRASNDQNIAERDQQWLPFLNSWKSPLRGACQKSLVDTVDTSAVAPPWDLFKLGLIYLATYRQSNPRHCPAFYSYWEMSIPNHVAHLAGFFDVKIRCI